MVAGPDISGMNTYPEETEICEKLIQLSFVKIVSSKSERGGARLRKNLLILRLLQKARLEQRNRLFAISRNAVSQTTTILPSADEGKVDMDIDHVVEEKEEEEEAKEEATREEIDISPMLEGKGVVECAEGDQTTKQGEDAHAVSLDGHKTEEKDQQSQIIIPVPPPSTSHPEFVDSPKRTCLKRKLDSDSSTYDQNNKIACILHHQTVQKTQLVFTVLKTAAANLNENTKDNQNRSLSCSNFMELTCES